MPTVSRQGAPHRTPGLALGLVAACLLATTATTARQPAGTADVAAQSAPVLVDDGVLAAASPDECFAGIGIDYPPINADGSCPAGVPKTNESYIWAFTEEGGKHWFGPPSERRAMALDGPARWSSCSTR